MSELVEPRRPLSARLVATTLLWIARTAGSLLAAWPLVWAIEASGAANGPARDAVLFRPGSLLLLELARTAAAPLGSAVKGALVSGALFGVLGLVPLGAALDLLVTAQVGAFATRLARGVRLLPGFLALGAITLLAQAALLLGTSLLGSALDAGLVGQDERLLNLLPIALFGLGVLGCAAFGAVLDVARATLAQRESKAQAALTQALRVVRERPLAVFSGAYPSVAGNAFAWMAAAWLMTRVDVGDFSGAKIALAFVVHQAAILLSIALRVRWLERALELGA